MHEASCIIGPVEGYSFFPCPSIFHPIHCLHPRHRAHLTAAKLILRYLAGTTSRGISRGETGGLVNNADVIFAGLPNNLSFKGYYFLRNCATVI